jgi:cobalt-zinc-cadmium efflux system outer membrane protein
VSVYHHAALLGAACVACLAQGQAAYGQASADRPQVSLDDAFARSLGETPVLRASEAAREAADAGVRQADRGVNPSIDFLLENALGTGLYQGIDRTEATLTFNQTLELGGDREARTQLAVRQGQRVRALGDVSRQDLLHQVEIAYIDAQRAQADLLAAEERLALAREVAATVARRVEAARDPLLAASRSNTLVAEAEIAVENARLADLAARDNLALFWDGATDFQIDMSTFDSLSGLEVDGASLAPEIVASRAAQQEAEARIAVERARSTLDPTVSAGLRYFRDGSEAAFVVGFSIPLGINDNNSAAVAKASADSSRARLETEILERNFERQTASARSQMNIAAREIAAIDERLVPAAEEAVERARAGYNQGGFSYLDVLDAQRVLSAARLQRNSALDSYHRANAVLKRLLGGYTASAPQ